MGWVSLDVDYDDSTNAEAIQACLEKEQGVLEVNIQDLEQPE